VVFDENTFPSLNTCSSATSPTTSKSIGISSQPLFFSLPSINQDFNILPIASCPGFPTVLPTNSPLPTPATPNSLSPATATTPVTSPLPTDDSHPNNPTTEIAPIPSLLPPDDSHTNNPIPHREILTRSKTGKLKAKEFPGFKTFLVTCHPLCVFSSIMIESEPTCFTKAVTKLEWRATMGCEFDALMANGTWSLCPRPLNKCVVRNK
jgi:hypothetical protein